MCVKKWTWIENKIIPCIFVFYSHLIRKCIDLKEIYIFFRSHFTRDIYTERRKVQENSRPCCVAKWVTSLIKWTLTKSNLLGTSFLVWYKQVKLTKILVIGTLFKIQYIQGFVLNRVRFRRVSLYTYMWYTDIRVRNACDHIIAWFKFTYAIFVYRH